MTTKPNHYESGFQPCRGGNETRFSSKAGKAAAMDGRRFGEIKPNWGKLE